MDIGEFLSTQGIRLRHQGNGNQKTTCPKCSHTRRNKTDRCLSVTIDHDGAVCHCHHCGWAAGSKGKHEPQNHKKEPQRDWRRGIKKGW